MSNSIRERRAQAERQIEANKAKAHAENHAAAFAKNGKPEPAKAEPKPEAASAEPSRTK